MTYPIAAPMFMAWGPMRDWLEAHGVTNMVEQAATLHVGHRQIVRWNQGHGIRWDVADRLAVAINRHPVDVWGEDWLLDDEEVDDGELG